MKDFRFATWDDIGELIKEIDKEKDRLIELRTSLQIQEEIYNRHINMVHEMLARAFHVVTSIGKNVGEHSPS